MILDSQHVLSSGALAILQLLGCSTKASSKATTIRLKMRNHQPRPQHSSTRSGIPREYRTGHTRGKEYHRSTTLEQQATVRSRRYLGRDICACLTITSLCHTPRREPRPPADAHTNEISPNPGKRSRLQSKTRKAQTLAPQTTPCYGCRPRHSHRTRCRRPPATRRNTTSTPQPAAAGE